MAVVKVWRSADRAWRIELDDRGTYRIVGHTMPLAAGRGGVREARAALAILPGAPTWDSLVED